ncbi:MAG: heavy-metal-associated domain-containing protein [Candidatus Accumulibacter sp.]|nr:heavy-metal-associated domain-containing protein [Accumulibacter sp.]
METIAIDVVGMHCQACVKSVSIAIQALPGVGRVEVALDSGKATISYDPSVANIAQLRGAIEEAGFDVG